jgi:hypothetical protein
MAMPNLPKLQMPSVGDQFILETPFDHNALDNPSRVPLAMQMPSSNAQLLPFPSTKGMQSQKPTKTLEVRRKTSLKPQFSRQYIVFMWS